LQWAINSIELSSSFIRLSGKEQWGQFCLSPSMPFREGVAERSFVGGVNGFKNGTMSGSGL